MSTRTKSKTDINGVQNISEQGASVSGTNSTSKNPQKISEEEKKKLRQRQADEATSALNNAEAVGKETKEREAALSASKKSAESDKKLELEKAASSAKSKELSKSEEKKAASSAESSKKTKTVTRKIPFGGRREVEVSDDEQVSEHSISHDGVDKRDLSKVQSDLLDKLTVSPQRSFEEEDIHDYENKSDDSDSSTSNKSDSSIGEDSEDSSEEMKSFFKKLSKEDMKKLASFIIKKKEKSSKKKDVKKKKEKPLSSPNHTKLIAISHNKDNYSKYSQNKLVGGEPLKVIDEYEEAFRAYRVTSPLNKDKPITLLKEWVKKGSGAWDIIEARSIGDTEVDQFWKQLRNLTKPNVKFTSNILTGWFQHLTVKKGSSRSLINCTAKSMDEIQKEIGYDLSWTPKTFKVLEAGIKYLKANPPKDNSDFTIPTIEELGKEIKESHIEMMCRETALNVGGKCIELFWSSKSGLNANPRLVQAEDIVGFLDANFMDTDGGNKASLTDNPVIEFFIPLKKGDTPYREAGTTGILTYLFIILLIFF